MDNPFSKYFSGQSPISTANYEPQNAEDYLSAGEVLGRPSAKNTAQRGISQSQQMKDAYDALMKGVDSLKDKRIQENLTLQTTRPATKSEMLMHTDVGGRSFLNPEEWQKRGLSPLAYSMRGSGSGAGITSAPQRSTSNVLEYGKEYQMRGEGGKPLYTSSGKPVTTSELTGTQLQEQFKGTFGRYGSEEEVGKFKRGEYESALQARGYASPSELQKQQQKRSYESPTGMEKGGLSNKLHPTPDNQQDNQ